MLVLFLSFFLSLCLSIKLSFFVNYLFVVLFIFFCRLLVSLLVAYLIFCSPHEPNKRALCTSNLFLVSRCSKLNFYSECQKVWVREPNVRMTNGKMERKRKTEKFYDVITVFGVHFLILVILTFVPIPAFQPRRI